MRYLVTVTLLTLAACGCHTTPSTARQELLVSHHSALVDTPRGTGTGFPIRDDAFLTAWHVVAGRKAEDVTVGGWQVIEIERLEGLDVAILYTGLHGERVWTLADRTALPGEVVFKSGYGAGEHWWTEGIATEDADRVSIDIFHGDSGGPVFDSRGRVLGMIVTVGGYGMEGRILHHAGVVPSTKILGALPEGFFEPALPLTMPPAPLAPVDEAWERFLRRKKELGL
jgi:S1-C subfamily serine protease